MAGENPQNAGGGAAGSSGENSGGGSATGQGASGQAGGGGTTQGATGGKAGEGGKSAGGTTGGAGGEQGSKGQGTEGAGKGGEQPAPTELEVKLPEGVEGGQLFDDFKAFAKESGFKGEHAQKLVDLYANHQKSVAQRDAEAFAQQRSEWLKTIETDKELGGANLEKTGGVVSRALERFATPELKSFLDQSGFGSHPEMVRFFHAVGQAMKEDSTIHPTRGSGGRGGNPSEEEVLRARYPSMFPKSP